MPAVDFARRRERNQWRDSPLSSMKAAASTTANRASTTRTARRSGDEDMAARNRLSRCRCRPRLGGSVRICGGIEDSAAKVSDPDRPVRSTNHTYFVPIQESRWPFKYFRSNWKHRQHLSAQWKNPFRWTPPSQKERKKTRTNPDIRVFDLMTLEKISKFQFGRRFFFKETEIFGKHTDTHTQNALRMCGRKGNASWQADDYTGNEDRRVLYTFVPWFHLGKIASTVVFLLLLLLLPFSLLPTQPHGMEDGPRGVSTTRPVGWVYYSLSTSSPPNEKKNPTRNGGRWVDLEKKRKRRGKQKSSSE